MATPADRITMELRNKGIIRLNSNKLPERDEKTSRTLIISGVARSGTSMIAGILKAAGVPLGEHMDQIVFEDNEFASIFEREPFDSAAMDAVLRARDKRYAVWGFKRPHLHVQGARPVELCRNPYLILTVRDPVAIAERNAISEHRDPAQVLQHAVQDLQNMLTFAQSLRCPVLLVSYEKALRNPEDFIQTLLDFCGLQVANNMLPVLATLVEPDRPVYLKSARRVFDGYLDGITENRLVGWAWQRYSSMPVAITLLRDGVPVEDVLADRPRADLRVSGYGDGRHGFEVDLIRCGFSSRSVVSAQIEGRSFMLAGSGSTVAELGGNQAIFKPRQIWPWNDGSAPYLDN